MEKEKHRWIKKSGHRFDQKKKRKTQALLAIGICLLALAGFFCKQKVWGPHTKDTMLHPKVTDSRSREKAREDFDTQLQKIFEEEVTDDTLTLNYSLKNPENYGIKRKNPTLGSFSIDALKNSLIVSENRIAMLETFDFEKLTDEQKLLYDIIYKMSNQNLKAADFLEYSEVLSPTSGIQAQLPVFFAEYNFYQKKDVEDYLELLTKVSGYFKEIIEFEKMKSDKGIFMSDITAQAIIEQCEEFIKDPGNNYMISIFARKLSGLSDIGEKEKKKFIEANRKEVLESVIPAYQQLIKGLKELKGTGKNDGGLCHLEKGKKYYEYLVQTKTGSDRSVKEIDNLLDDKIAEYKKEMSGLMTKDPTSYYAAQSVEYAYNTPEKSLEHLKKCVEKDFPAIAEDISCEIKKIDASLENSMSPAFYLTPAIDDYKNNVIYVNGSKHYDLSKAFTTLAHEGYPGHLYQNCYFRAQHPNPLRCVVHVGGYTEGWGVYSEIYSYDKAKLSKNVAKLLKLNTLLTLCVYAKADIGIHYSGWTYKETQVFLDDYGFGKSSAKTIFDAIVADPADYMQYTLGFLEIKNLEEKAKAVLKDQFDKKKFYGFFLSIGPAPFEIIENRMDIWMKQ